MDEVDKIILLTLRQLGTDVDDDVASLKQLSVDSFVEGCGRCLNAIQNSDEAPLKLPANKAAQFRVGTNLAKACKGLGYPDEIGYNTFLFPNDSDSRQLLMWLIERLPKETSTATAETLSEAAMLSRSIANEMKRRMEHPWLPPFLQRQGFVWREKGRSWHVTGQSSVKNFHAYPLSKPGTSTSAEFVRYQSSDSMPFVTEQVAFKHSRLSSILDSHAREKSTAAFLKRDWEANGGNLGQEEYRSKKGSTVAKSMRDKLRSAAQKAKSEEQSTDMLSFLKDFASVRYGKASMFRSKGRLQFAAEDEDAGAAARPATEEELRQQREEEVSQLESNLEQLGQSLKSITNDIARFRSEQESMSRALRELEEANGEMEQAMAVRKEVLDLLPNADENIAKLQNVVDEAASRITTLAERWEEVRTELIAEYRKLLDAAADQEGEKHQQLEAVKHITAQISELGEEARSKDGLLKQLRDEAESISSEVVGREEYTRRIMEIAYSIGKQNKEINKVLMDTRVLQKDLNQLAAKLDRTFTVTDELIFKDAKKDENVKQAYKYLAQLHENCDGLIKTVEETGAIVREIRTLEDQIEAEQRKGMAAALERISGDLAAMKKENAGLVQKIKGGSSA